MNGMRTASGDVTEFLAGVPTGCMGFTRGNLERCLFVHEPNGTRVVAHVDDPRHCGTPATLDRFSIHMAKLVVIKRGEALNPHIPVVYMDTVVFKSPGAEICCETYFEVRGRMLGSCSCTECVICCDAVDEQNISNLHSDTTACDQVQHALYRAVVGTNAVHYQGETGSSVRDKMVVVQTSVANMCRFHTRQEGAGYLKGTRQMNLYLAVPELTNTSRDTLTLTGLETQQRGKTLLAQCATLTNSSGESELYALGALLAELIPTQAILNEIELSFHVHPRADSSTRHEQWQQKKRWLPKAKSSICVFECERARPKRGEALSHKHVTVSHKRARRALLAHSQICGCRQPSLELQSFNDVHDLDTFRHSHTVRHWFHTRH